MTVRPTTLNLEALKKISCGLSVGRMETQTGLATRIDSA